MYSECYVVVDLVEVLARFSNQQLCYGSDGLIWCALLQPTLLGDIVSRNGHMQPLIATPRLFSNIFREVSHRSRYSNSRKQSWSSEERVYCGKWTVKGNYVAPFKTGSSSPNFENVNIVRYVNFTVYVGV